MLCTRGIAQHLDASLIMQSETTGDAVSPISNLAMQYSTAPYIKAAASKLSIATLAPIAATLWLAAPPANGAEELWDAMGCSGDALVVLESSAPPVGAGGKGIGAAVVGKYGFDAGWLDVEALSV